MNKVIRTKFENREDSCSGACRICLIETDCQNIFELDYEDQDIVDIFYFCTRIELLRESNDSDDVCISCISELIQAYEFIRKCQTSNAFLLSIIADGDNNSKKDKNNQVVKERIDDDTDIQEIEIKRISHECLECSREFSTSAGLKNHSRTHDITSNSNKGSLEKQIDGTDEIEINQQKPSYKCPNCPKEFTTSAGLKNHFNAHENEETRKNEKESLERKILDTEIKQLKSCRKCPKCEKEFSTAAGLKIHYRSHANSTGYTCKVCDRTFTSTKNRGQHMLTHTTEKPFRCKQCNKGFRSKTTLQAHLMIHTGERPVICEFCAQKFKQTKDLKYHHSQGDCASKDKNEPITCNICLKQMTSYRALRQHDSIVHCKKEHLCNQCGKGFISFWGLKQHLLTHTSNRPYACTVCHKRFLQKHGLKKHMYLHTGERPHRCKLCEKSFVQHHHLATHMRMHSGHKPHTCPICSKGFTMKSNLTVHIRMHTGETPYVCELCDAAYHDSSSLRKHKVKHDLANVKKTDNFVCNNC